METLRELLTSKEATPETAPGVRTFDMAGANNAKYPPLPDIAKEWSNRMWVLQAQAVVHVGAGGSAWRCRQKHDEPDGNVLSRGEGEPSPALVRCKQPGVSDQAQATMNFC